MYPYASYGEPGGAPLPKKTTAAGVVRRARLLKTAGLAEEDLPLWSHDALDAGLAVVVGADGVAIGVGHDVTSSCGGDGSRIWLPEPRAR